MLRRSRKAVNSTGYSVVGLSHHPWEPGPNKLPYRGFAALFLALAGILVAIAILFASNGAEVRHWRFQPTVYISIASTTTNIALVYALIEGVSISWWSKALKDGTNVADLHRIWAFGNSFTSAVLCGRHFNLVALASILVAVSPINGPLLQRASTIGSANVDTTQRLQLDISKLIPEGFTGLSSSRANIINMLTTNFSTVARDYYNRVAIPFKSECIDSCRANVLGAGFHVNCSSYQAPYNASPGYDDYFRPVTIFGAELNYAVDNNPVAASLNIQYKPSAGCEGELLVRNCSLTAGTVSYDVAINGPASTISLAPGSTIWDDIKIGRPDYLTIEDDSGQRSTYGGIFLALANQFDTNLILQFGGGIGWEFFGAQSTASISYARNIGDRASCNISFTDPTADFLEATRELIFRTAVASAAETNTQHVTVQATGTHTVYHTNYLFVALATLVSLLGIVAVLLTFHGSQRLGRQVSLSPIEVAKAFGAPILRGASSNARTRDLLRQVGDRSVKYGVVNDTKIARKPLSHDTSRSPYTDESPYSNAMPEHAYSDTAPGTTRQHRWQQPVEEDASHHAPQHTSWQSGFNSGFGSDVELVDTRRKSVSAGNWLEIANPKSVTAVEKGMSFGQW